jgi:hypothetical protein
MAPEEAVMNAIDGGVYVVQDVYQYITMKEADLVQV